MNPKITTAALAVTTLFSGAAPAQAQKYPVKPIVIVVPYAAGGSTDLTGRIFAHDLSKVVGQSVVVENRSNTVQGMIDVGKARPDGYTLGLFGTGGFTHYKYLVPVTRIRRILSRWPS